MTISTTNAPNRPPSLPPPLPLGVGESLFRGRFGVVFSRSGFPSPLIFSLPSRGGSELVTVVVGEVRLLMFGRKEDDKKKPDRIRISADTREFYGYSFPGYPKLADTDPDTIFTDLADTDPDPDTPKIPDIWIHNRPSTK
ncbi:predicted protein [Arabidopsis lyrata subsp. lyrata]|uniref:Predicted protein n=1 Tax=Arabidopsis lyrata subsp. lyrata TaxID=81972 RepID=D7M8B3_ARALL|nr:predicted protein [Arabidopsis lyrata subsp. lyrata]